MSPLLDLIGSAAASPGGAAIVVNCAIKGVLILLLALVATGLLRKATASVRHLIWTLAIMALCVLPMILAFAPGLRVPVLPPSVFAAAAEAPRPLPRPDGAFRAKIKPQQILLGHAITEPEPAAPVADMTEHRSIDAILWLWAAGAAMVLARLFVSLAAVWNKGRRAAPITDPTWAALATEIARDLKIQRPVSLRLNAENTTPATWGLSQPVILLPTDAVDWPLDRLRAVLSHELAHVARGDFLVQNLARAACALHWFNPLAWLAERRLRAECEQACDDLVLEGGLKASDYATHLLDVLMAAQRGREAPMAALAMGRLNGLEHRLRAILDERRPRRRLSARSAALIALGAAAFVMPLGLVRIEARAHDVPKLERLPQGMTIEVIAVSTHPSGPATWWAPDGTPLGKAPCDPDADVIQAPGQQVREIVAKISGLPQGASVTWFPSQSRSRGAPARKEGADLPDLRRTIAEFAADLTACDVRFDIELGPWEVERTHDGRNSIAIENADHAYFFGTVHETRQGSALTIAHNIANRVIRVVAIDREGKLHEARSTSTGAAGHLLGVDVEFDLPPAQIREYQLQSRPVGRFEIKNVSLRPRQAGR